jgi:hypothetical protein
LSNELLDLRRKGLEESFFARHNQELLEQLRRKRDADELRRELVETSGVKSEVVLDELVSLGVGAPALAALGLVPLVMVAWADGEIQEKERRVLTETADGLGIHEGTKAWALFDSWLQRAPDQELFDAWRDYVAALRESFSAESYELLRSRILERAEAVARASGGILGVGSVYGTEKDVMSAVREAFAE